MSVNRAGIGFLAKNTPIVGGSIKLSSLGKMTTP